MQFFNSLFASQCKCGQISLQRRLYYLQMRSRQRGFNKIYNFMITYFKNLDILDFQVFLDFQVADSLMAPVQAAAATQTARMLPISGQDDQISNI